MHSRMQRGGMKLHKNLLVASVLQKARCTYMEEAMIMQSMCVPSYMYQSSPSMYSTSSEMYNKDVDTGQQYRTNSCALESSSDSESDLEQSDGDQSDSDVSESDNSDVEDEEKGDKQQIIDNYHRFESWRRSRQAASKIQSTQDLTCPVRVPKRRRKSDCGSTIEPPKKLKVDNNDKDSSDLEKPTPLRTNDIQRERLKKDSAGESSPDSDSDSDSSENSLKLDRMTSLVSLFSVAALSAEDRLARCISSPDLCASQAKDGSHPFLYDSQLAVSV